MSKLAPTNIPALQKALRNFEDAVNREISDHAGIAGGPDLTNIQTALNLLKTSLSNVGFTIS